MKIEPFEKYTQRYNNWFDKNKFVYESELKAIEELIPNEKGVGVEIGIGTGRFASRLGIEFGTDPSPKMRALAKEKHNKILITDYIAEKLFYSNSTFDYALMVTTLCFLDDVKKAFNEIYRILKPEGYFIIAFVDKNSLIGKLYQKNKQKNVFYKEAKFYSTENVINFLKKAKFKDLEFRQTIFQDLSKIKQIEPVKSGYGEGSFVVIKTKK